MNYYYLFILHHNIVYSKSHVYNNLNDPGAHIKGPLKHMSYSFGFYISS
jgi:hypothetical protein